jgi:hypothetical protein
MADDAFVIVETPRGLTLQRKRGGLSVPTLRRVAACIFVLTALAAALAVLSTAVATVTVLVLLGSGNLVVLILDAEFGGNETDAVRRELVVVAADAYRSSRPEVHVDGKPLGAFADVVSFDTLSHERSGLKRSREVTVLVERGESLLPELVSLGSFEDLAQADSLAAVLRRAGRIVPGGTPSVATGSSPTAAFALMVAIVFGLPLAMLAVFVLLGEGGGALTLPACLLRGIAVVAVDLALLRAGTLWNRRLLTRWSQARVAAAVSATRASIAPLD